MQKDSACTEPQNEKFLERIFVVRWYGTLNNEKLKIDSAKQSFFVVRSRWQKTLGEASCLSAGRALGMIFLEKEDLCMFSENTHIYLGLQKILEEKKVISSVKLAEFGSRNIFTGARAESTCIYRTSLQRITQTTLWNMRKEKLETLYRNDHYTET